MKKQVFKKYNQNNLNLPPLETLVPEGHLARTINDFVESLDKTNLEGLYKGGGSSAYHPQMLLKVLLYAYSVGNYSSRGWQQEKTGWLCGKAAFGGVGRKVND